MTHYYTFKSCVQTEDSEAIIDFLYTIKDELYLPDRAVCRQITKLCFAHGGVVGVYDDRQMVAMMGYFYGEPQCDYVNKETAFLYVAGIRPAYRLTRVFYQGLLFALRHFQEVGALAIKLQAEAANPYTNKLYGRFARPIKRSKSLRGKEVITYGSSIVDALFKLQPRKRSSVRRSGQMPRRYSGLRSNFPPNVVLTGSR